MFQTLGSLVDKSSSPHTYGCIDISRWLTCHGITRRHGSLHCLPMIFVSTGFIVLLTVIDCSKPFHVFWYHIIYFLPIWNRISDQISNNINFNNFTPLAYLKYMAPGFFSDSAPDRLGYIEGLFINIYWSILIYTYFNIFAEVNFAWAAHQVHHSSEDYNLTTALRQPLLQRYKTWVREFSLHYCTKKINLQ